MNPFVLTDYVIFVVSMLLALSLMFDLAGYLVEVFAAGTLFGAALLRVLLR